MQSLKGKLEAIEKTLFEREKEIDEMKKTLSVVARHIFINKGKRGSRPCEQRKN
jgi:hypothetical protein